MGRGPGGAGGLGEGVEIALGAVQPVGGGPEAVAHEDEVATLATAGAVARREQVPMLGGGGSQAGTRQGEDAVIGGVVAAGAVPIPVRRA